MGAEDGMTGDGRRGAIGVDRVDGVWVVALTGEHDLSTSPGLGITLERLLSDDQRSISRATVIAVDLSTVQFFDSSVISAMLSASQAAERDPDAALALVVGDPECFAARMLTMFGLTRLVPTFATREEAVAALSARAGAA
jgi:anti-anti-sigma factor